MVLNSNHILVAEIVKKHGVSVANFSPLAKDETLVSTGGYIKVGGTTIIDKTSKFLPNYIKEMACSGGYTDLSGYFMANDLREDYYLSDEQIKKIGTNVSISGKSFIKIDESLIEIFTNPRWTVYPLTKEEIVTQDMEDLVEKKQFKQIDKNTFLVWY